MPTTNYTPPLPSSIERPVRQQPTYQPYQPPGYKPSTYQPPVKKDDSSSSSVRVSRSSIKGLFMLIGGFFALIGWGVRKVMG